MSKSFCGGVGLVRDTPRKRDRARESERITTVVEVITLFFGVVKARGLNFNPYQ